MVKTREPRGIPDYVRIHAQVRAEAAQKMEKLRGEIQAGKIVRAQTLRLMEKRLEAEAAAQINSLRQKQEEELRHERIRMRLRESQRIADEVRRMAIEIFEVRTGVKFTNGHVTWTEWEQACHIAAQALRGSKDETKEYLIVKQIQKDETDAIKSEEEIESSESDQEEDFNVDVLACHEKLE